MTRLKRVLLITVFGSLLLYWPGTHVVGQTANSNALDLTFRPAQEPSGSWAASVAMVLEYTKGYRMEQCQIVTLEALTSLTTPKGINTCCAATSDDDKICKRFKVTQSAQIGATLEKLGVHNTVIGETLSFEQIVENIDSNRPVIAWLENAPLGGEAVPHAVIVSGYWKRDRYGSTDKLVTVLDPLRPQLRVERDERVRPQSRVERDEREGPIHYEDLRGYYGRGYRWIATILPLDTSPVWSPKWETLNEALPLSSKAIRAGAENGQPLYLCQARGAIGTLVEGKCRIQFGQLGKEITSPNYEILVGDTSYTAWVPFEAGLNGAFSAFRDLSSSLYICRAFYKGNLHFGYVRRTGSYCDITDTDELATIRNYFEVLHFTRPLISTLPTAALESKLGQDLDDVENRFREHTKSLVLIRGTLPDGGSLEGYDVKQVKQVIEQGKLWLLERLEEIELSGMKAYLDRFYPVANALITFKAKTGQVAEFREPKASTARMRARSRNFVSLGNTARIFQTTEQELATPGSTDSAISAVFSFFAKLRKNIKAVDLEVTSDPDQAGVQLKTALGKVRTTSTNSQFRNVFRGLYTYIITKTGYKTIQQELNLIDESGSTLGCKLYASKVRDGPYPCSLKDR